MRRFILKTFLMACGFSALSLSRVEAYSIGWGDTFFDNDLTSTGTPIDSSFHFELGTFGAFIPDESNLPLWRSSWKLLDTASYNNTTKLFTDTATLVYDSLTSTYTSASAPAPSAQFAEGEQVYLWVYNNTEMDWSTEWGIFTRTGSVNPLQPSWVLPSGAGDQTNWTLQMLTPYVNDSPYGGTPTVTGPGGYTEPGGAFSFQTHNFVPEPGSALMLALAGAMGLARRRR